MLLVIMGYLLDVGPVGVGERLAIVETARETKASSSVDNLIWNDEREEEVYDYATVMREG